MVFFFYDGKAKVIDYKVKLFLRQLVATIYKIYKAMVMLLKG